MSFELLEQAARDLGDLTRDVAFLGGATITLWITDPGAPPIRPTRDVDVVVEGTARTAFHDFEQRLRDRRFDEDQEEGVICRWRHRDSGLILDAMPADAAILGFENRWQAPGLAHAVDRVLPSGATIRAIPPPHLLATKLEAFKSRGRNDFLASADFEDVVALIDGREELLGEVRQAAPEVRGYVAEELVRLRADPRFEGGLFGALRSDATSQARAETVVLPRIRELTNTD